MTNPVPDRDGDDAGLNRRTVLRGVAVTGVLGASASFLAACGGDESGSGSAGESGGGSEGGSEGGSGGGSGSGSSGATDLGAASEVPVGGGVVFADQKVVVTQAGKDNFQAFSAVCTHQGCTLGEVTDGTINCPCHGSRFNLDGTVANGPATEPLPPKKINVQGGNITLA